MHLYPSNSCGWSRQDSRAWIVCTNTLTSGYSLGEKPDMVYKSAGCSSQSCFSPGSHLSPKIAKRKQHKEPLGLLSKRLLLFLISLCEIGSMRYSLVGMKWTLVLYHCQLSSRFLHLRLTLWTYRLIRKRKVIPHPSIAVLIRTRPH